jgi:predicted nucleotidyltransferase
MAKVPNNPQEIFGEITDDFKIIFGDDLLSIILYGSGASGHYIPGKSDLNFLIVLTEEGIGNLGNAISAVARRRKQKVAIPLCMTKAEVSSSLDSYPIEFLTMKKHYIPVYGEDVLGGLSIEPSQLRVQCEREMKGKILLLRRGLLKTGGQAKQVRELIKASLTAFISIFKALLYLKGVDIPQSRRDVIQSVAKVYTIDPDVFLKCTDIKEGIDRIQLSEIHALFKAYQQEIEKLSRIIDSMSV